MTSQKYRETPKYGKVLQEAKGVHKRIIKFVKKYPNYDEYLTDEQVLYKMQIDYRMSLSNKYGTSSYMRYFNDMSRDLTKGMMGW